MTVTAMNNSSSSGSVSGKKLHRVKPDSLNIPDLEILDEEDLLIIDLKASILSLEECLAFLCLTSDDLPEYDLCMATKIHTRGRLRAVSTAGEKLFSAMSMRGGGAVSLDYLRQMSSNFQLTLTPNPSSASGFTFNVVMPDED